MSSNPEAAQRGESGKYGLAKLALLSLLTGAGIGLVIGCFRVALDHMNTDSLLSHDRLGPPVASDGLRPGLCHDRCNHRVRSLASAAFRATCGR